MVITSGNNFTHQTTPTWKHKTFIKQILSRTCCQL